MAKALDKINQELTALEEKVEGVNREIRGQYGEYSGLIAQTVKRQLVTLFYQISTHVYPENFLKLSLSERERLQQAIRDLGQTGSLLFEENLENPLEVPPEKKVDFRSEILKKLPITPEQLEKVRQHILKRKDAELAGEDSSSSEEFIVIGKLEDGEELELDVQSDSLDSDPLDFMDEEDDEDELTDEEDDEEEEEDEDEITHTLLVLVRWLKQVERGLNQVLKQLSQEGNQILIRARIFPSQVPSKVLEAAIQAEEGGATGNAPNLLNLLIEGGREQVVPVTALRLRLSELEFGDPMLARSRSRIRELNAQVKSLHKQYQQLQREKAIAEAEAAWRASWYEEN
ncbi:hypothetical protein K4A83_04635 [Spirulina subsalsa FACHB-351]|uniref:Uncharacterized protein n=1 Tax=Spirulina subsalsa FACHB-351 TaxID=234711 RepID=A0ABT3L231_9CYAN|nr:hypothetical protein [Spirulina subsalsa]MCW6035561.1 hypothetical protein [Spirulina subsalsa FACHB-351]